MQGAVDTLNGRVMDEEERKEESGGEERPLFVCWKFEHGERQEDTKRRADEHNQQVEALFAACRSGDVQAIRALLDQKPALVPLSPLAKDASGHTLLHTAASSNQQAVCDVLLDELRLNPHEPTPQGQTAAEVAEAAGWTELAAYLRQRERRFGRMYGVEAGLNCQDYGEYLAALEGALLKQV